MLRELASLNSRNPNRRCFRIEAGTNRVATETAPTMSAAPLDAPSGGIKEVREVSKVDVWAVLLR